MTADFLEDAMDNLEKFDGEYLLLAGTAGGITCHRCSAIHTLEQLAWFRRRFDEYTANIESRILSGK